MKDLRNSAYRFVRTKVPLPIRRALKSVPGVRRIAEDSRPRSDRLLPVDIGAGASFQMYLPEAFHWISYDGYEPESLAWVAEHVQAGAVCLDVGGHMGVYALLMGRLVGPSGRVLTFEPLSANVGFLRRNIALNGLADRVTLVEAAVDTEDGGTVELFVGDGTSEASVHEHATRPDRSAVPRISLDSEIQRRGLGRLDLIKMDIEGAEERALRGAEWSLGRFSPTLLLEVHGDRGVGGLAYLESLGYQATLLSGETVTADTFPDRIIQVIVARDA